MPTVAILYWDHPVSVVEELARAMGRALESLGVDVRLFGVLHANFAVKESVILEMLADPAVVNCDIVLSVSAPPLMITVGDKWLFEVVGKSFFFLATDALYYDYARLAGVAEFVDHAKSSDRLGIMWLDRDDCRLIDQLIARPAYHIRTVGSFSPISRGERIKRVAVVATMGAELVPVGESTFEDLVMDAPPAVRDRQRLSAFAEAIERPGPIESIQHLATEYLGISVEEMYTYELTQYLSRLDAFQKRRRRRLTIEALRDVPIDIFGPGWEPYTADFTDCRYLGSVHYSQLPNLCQQYSVILDFNPGFGHGLHDRLMMGVGNGCRVLTNSCRAISDLNLPDPDAVIPYLIDPNLADLARQALALPAIEPESLLSFRKENSWLARMDKFLLSELGR